MSDAACLICNRDIEEDERPYCAIRKLDMGLVRPKCQELVKRGNRDALDKLANSRRLFVT